MNAIRVPCGGGLIGAWLALLLVCAGPAVAAAPKAASVLAAAGRVEMLRSGAGRWESAVAGTQLRGGDRIRTGPTGRAALLLADESIVRLGHGTSFELKAVAPRAGWLGLAAWRKRVTEKARSLYHLLVGRVWILNKNRNPAISIRTPALTAGIRGTEFAVEVDEDGTTRVTVLEGRVEAANPYGRTEVAVGEQAYARPGSAPAKRLLAQPENAVQWLITVPRLIGPGEFEARTRAARRIVALLASSRLDKAQAALDEALAVAPGDPDLEALAAYREVLDAGVGTARERLVRLVDAHPGHALAWRLLALDEAALGHPNRALAASERAVALAPRSAGALIVASYVQQSRFALDTALDVIDRALALDPGNVLALAARARLLFGQGRIAEASAAIAAARVRAPDDAGVLTLAGFLALARHDGAQALAAFERAARLDPGQGDARLGLGLARMRRGEVEDALAAVSAAVALEPRRALFYTYWGKMLSQVGRPRRALDILERAAALDPRDPSPWLYRAIVLRDLNRPVEAVRALNRAVRLNGNRGVYRSRFLLDGDRAVKNVNLSRLYDQLGLSAWSQSKAIAAIKDDYLNSSAHLHYAGALAGQPNRAFAFSAEQLLARLLMPANVNTFNTFNEYTSLFEHPDAGGTLALRGGSDDRRDGNVVAYAAVPEANLALQAGGFFERTGGWRGTNFDRLRSVAGIAKWEPTLDDGVMLAGSRTETRQGDLNFPRYEYHAAGSPNDRTGGDVTRMELGYHHRFAPGSELLAYLAHVDLGSRALLNTTASGTAFGVPASFFTRDDRRVDQPYDQAQFEYLLRRDRHHWIAGTLQYRGDVDTDRPVEILVTGPSASLPLRLVGNGALTSDVRFESYYLHDAWAVVPRLKLEAALYRDRMRNTNALSGVQWTLDRWDPRLGLIFDATPADTLRLAWFRYLLPFISARIDPTDVAGIPIFLDTEQGADVRQVSAMWEHEWAFGWGALQLFDLRKGFTDRVAGVGGVLENRVRNGTRRGVALDWNGFVGERCGLALGLRFERVRDDLLPSSDRNERFAKGKLTCVAPSGWSASLTQTHRHLDLVRRASDEEIWNTDAELAYELPEKVGTVAVSVHNLFDRHYDWVTDRFTLQGMAPARQITATFSVNF